jgi:hypothetical protein
MKGVGFCERRNQKKATRAAMDPYFDWSTRGRDDSFCRVLREA